MPLPSFLESSTQFAPDPPMIVGLPPNVEPRIYKRPKRLPSRILVRHVLRIRFEAARDLAATLLEIEEKDCQVNASFWLAQEHDGEVLKADREDDELVEWERPFPRGQRSGAEVVAFLRRNGARLGGSQVEGHWAASSGDETERDNHE